MARLARPAGPLPRVLGVILSAVIFVIDLLTPLGIAGGVPYVTVVLLATRMPRVAHTWIAASACTGLTILGFFFSPSGAGILPSLANRALALFAIWTTALVSLGRRRAEKTIELALRGAPYAVLMVGTDGRIELTNPRVKEIFGYEEEELLGESVDQLVPLRFRADHADHRASFGAQPSVRAMGAGRELHAVRKDGTEVPVEIGLTPVTVEKRSYVLATVIDITERKRAEEATADRNEELQTLVHVISHDLKEPLRAIESFSKIVRDRYQDRLDAKGQDFLRRVIDAARRLKRLLDDVLRIARARQPGEQRKVVPGDELVRAALDRLRHRIDERHAQIVVGTSLPTLSVDETLATEAIYNLVSNALKFTRPGEAPRVEIDAYHCSDGDGRVAGLVVRDRGPGVPRDQAERVFELFQRGVGREIDGTGAGLAIVRAIAARHGGRAWVQTRDGGGSEFVITFEKHG